MQPPSTEPSGSMAVGSSPKFGCGNVWTLDQLLETRLYISPVLMKFFWVAPEYSAPTRTRPSCSIFDAKYNRSWLISARFLHRPVTYLGYVVGCSEHPRHQLARLRQLRARGISITTVSST